MLYWNKETKKMDSFFLFLKAKIWFKYAVYLKCQKFCNKCFFMFKISGSSPIKYFNDTQKKSLQCGEKTNTYIFMIKFFCTKIKYIQCIIQFEGKCVSARNMNGKMVIFHFYILYFWDQKNIHATWT